MRFAFYTLGCKVNQYETQALEQLLQKEAKMDSRCAKASVEETVAFYKAEGYDGIFITNHFIDGNIKLNV